MSSNKHLLKEIISLHVDQNLLLEITNKEFKKEIVNTGLISIEDYENKIFNKKRQKFRKPFTEPLYLEFLASSIKSNEEERFSSLDDFIEMYDLVKPAIIDPYYKEEIDDFQIGADEYCSIFDLDYYKIKRYFEYQEEKNVKSSALSSLIKSVNFEEIGNYRHFNVVALDKDYIICEPKTTKGSIALGRSYWCKKTNSLRYDKTFNKFKAGFGSKCGKMKWCTTLSSDAHFFDNYVNYYGISLFYLIKKDYIKTDPDRKICIGFQYFEPTSSDFIVNLADYYSEESGLQTNVNSENKFLYEESHCEAYIETKRMFANNNYYSLYEDSLNSEIEENAIDLVLDVTSDIANAVGGSLFKKVLNVIGYDKNHILNKNAEKHSFELDIENPSSITTDNLEIVIENYLSTRSEGSIKLLKNFLQKYIELNQGLDHVIQVTEKIIADSRIDIKHRIDLYKFILSGLDYYKSDAALYVLNKIHSNQTNEYENKYFLDTTLRSIRLKSMSNKLFYYVFVKLDLKDSKEINLYDRVIKLYLADSRTTSDMIMIILIASNTKSNGRLWGIDSIIENLKLSLKNLNCSKEILKYIVNNHHTVGDFYREDIEKNTATHSSYDTFSPTAYLGVEDNELTSLIYSANGFDKEIKDMIRKNNSSIKKNIYKGMSRVGSKITKGVKSLADAYEDWEQKNIN